MTSNLLIFGSLAELALVTGQLLLKRAMHVPPDPPAHSNAAASATAAVPMPVRVLLFIISIAAQTLYFFLWLGLLHNYPLSTVYPFDAGALLLLVLAGVLLLRESLTLRAALAMILILSGLALISCA